MAYFFFIKRSKFLVKKSRAFAKSSGAGFTADDIKVNVKKSLPPMAWICLIDSGGARFNVGTQVECRNKMVFEGAWSGSFRHFSPGDSDFIFGSGATLKENRIGFITPKHSLESIFVLFDNKTGRLSISNSIAFLLSEAHIRKGSHFMDLLNKNIENSASRAAEMGIDRYPNLIAEDKTYSLLRMTYFNFEVDNSGTIRPIWQPIRRYFTTFSQYKDLLSSVMRSVLENASDSMRSVQYRPISAISQGYDSVAISSLGKDNGVSECITIDTTVYGINDSGHKIAKQLGMKVYKAKHILTEEINNMRIALSGDKAEKAFEFIATDGIGDDVAFLGFEKTIRNRLYLSGSYGDVIWNKTKRIHNGLSKKVFERSITEYRLRTGFINVPLISVGARYISPVLNITNNPEILQGYSVGGEYDRPIPRKIAEEAGVKRSMFGIKKNATSPIVLNRSELFSEAMNFVMKRYK